MERWEKEREYEYLSKEEKEKLLTERMKSLLRRVYEKVPYYREVMKKEKLDPEKFSSLSDLKYFPFTTKDTLREHYPFGLFAVPLEEVVELHASSGTTGKPTVVGYTREDIEIWKSVMARSVVCAGGSSQDIIHNAYGYGLFTGGLGFHYAALALGAGVVPVSSGGTKRQISLIMDFKPTILCCTPSYALYLAEVAREEVGINPAETSLRIGIFGAEPWSEGMRKALEKEWGIIALDVYGLSEIIGPGVAMECPGKVGLHVWDDHFYPEVIDPKTGEVLEEGEEGELVFTTLTKEALPLIRYRTRDIVSMTWEPCPHCGRKTPRISRIKGRTDDMLIIRGINVFPSQIESVITEIPGVAPHYQLVVTREKHLDKLEIQIEMTEEFPFDEVRKVEELERKVKDEIESVLGLKVEVKLLEPKSIQRSMGKAKRVIDKRKEGVE